MREPSFDRWAEHLTRTARALPYPATPNLAAGAGRRLAQRAAPAPARRWQFALLALALVALGLLAVPAARAAVVQFIQIGVVRIFVGPPTPTPAPTANPTGLSVPPTAASAGPHPATPPPPTGTPSLSLIDSLAGETTLADAQRRAGFNVLLPAYPSDLGPPGRIFLQTGGAPMVVLVWLNPDQPDGARLALFEIAPGNIGLQKSEFFKGVPPSLQNTTVHGLPAAWTTGPYLLELRDGDISFDRLIEGHVLIWVENGLTYRLELEINATLDEALKTAESLH